MCTAETITRYKIQISHLDTKIEVGSVEKIAIFVFFGKSAIKSKTIGPKTAAISYAQYDIMRSSYK